MSIYFEIGSIKVNITILPPKALDYDALTVDQIVNALEYKVTNGTLQITDTEGNRLEPDIYSWRQPGKSKSIFAV